MGNLIAGPSLVSSVFGDNDMRRIDENVDRTLKEHEARLASQRAMSHYLSRREQEEGVEPGHGPSRVLNFLFLGDRFTARDVDALKKAKVGYILHLNDIATPPEMEERFKGFEYIRLPASDNETDNIIMYFEKIVNFIDQARQAWESKSKEAPAVLVFCDEGVSRSPTAVIAYLLHRGWTLKSAIEQVRKAHPRSAPNSGFFNQLIEEEERLTGHSTVKASDYTKYFG